MQDSASVPAERIAYPLLPQLKKEPGPSSDKLATVDVPNQILLTGPFLFGGRFNPFFRYSIWRLRVSN